MLLDTCTRRRRLLRPVLGSAHLVIARAVPETLRDACRVPTPARHASRRMIESAMSSCAAHASLNTLTYGSVRTGTRKPHAILTSALQAAGRVTLIAVNRANFLVSSAQVTTPAPSATLCQIFRICFKLNVTANAHTDTHQSTTSASSVKRHVTLADLDRSMHAWPAIIPGVSSSSTVLHAWHSALSIRPSILT